ncbi:MAG: hypothetical protein IJ348_05565 [Alistipes sp.]|nr:hypothetical protein [Alistipes sp.]
MKKMPYSLPEGGIEGVKMRCRAAVARAESSESARRATEPRRAVIPRWAFAAAFAVVAFMVVVALGVIPNVKGGLMTDYVACLEQMPTEVLYEECTDAVEYYDYDDINLLLN